jgi:hypothetical protein
MPTLQNLMSLVQEKVKDSSLRLLDHSPAAKSLGRVLQAEVSRPS